MNVLKGKFFALALTFIFAISNFSGQCVQAMDGDGSMEMNGFEMSHQESLRSAPGDDTQSNSGMVSCAESCGLSFDELSSEKIVPFQTEVLGDTHALVGYRYVFELDNIHSRYVRLNKNPLVHASAGSFHDRIKLII